MATTTTVKNAESMLQGGNAYFILACITMLLIIVALLIYIIREKRQVKKPKKRSSKVQTGGKIKSSHKKQINIPKTVQDTIPYKHIYGNGLIHLKDNLYSKAFELSDANFCSVPETEQENILNAFAEVLNILPYQIGMETTVFDRTRDQIEIEKEVMMQPYRDTFNEIREEFNEKVLKTKLKEGNNNIKQSKYMILTVDSKSIKEANNIFLRLETEFNSILTSVTPEGIKPLTIKDRLKSLYEVYNMNSPFSYGEKRMLDGTTIIVENLEWLNKQGLSSKDSIGPSSFKFMPDYFIMNEGRDEIYGSILYLKDMSNTIMPDITREITSIPCNKLLSTHYETEREDQALKMLKVSLTNINSNVIEAQKNASKQGFSPDLISEELLTTQAQARETLQSVMVNNQKVFYITMVVAVFAESKEKLDEYVANVKTAGTKYMCTIKELKYMQEKGLNTALPLGLKDIPQDRLQITSSATAFHPYTSIDLMHKDGIWYGQNYISHNMCMIDRGRGMNYNGILIGQSGSGKSMFNKNEKSQAIMKYPHDSFYFIDPDAEYKPLAQKYNGQIVRIANGTNTFINPLDMDINYGDSIEESIALKVDYLESICETMAGGIYGLSPEVIGIINRCGRLIYKPYVEHMNSIAHKGITIDYEAMPTLFTFYETLLEQPEPAAKELALQIEPYCAGTKDIFAHTTNVNINSRVVVFDIKDLGTGMKDLGIQVCSNYIWNKGISNRILSKKLLNKEITKDQLPNKFINETSRTWVDIDEFHTVIKTDTAARIFVEYWKRARKWEIILTGLTQNFSDLMRTDDTKSILKNSYFVAIMNITSMDRQDAYELYNLSDSQMKYVSNPVPGRGLLCWGEKTIIQLDSTYPKECSLFKVLSTKNKDFLDAS